MKKQRILKGKKFLPSVTLSESNHSLQVSRFNTGTETSLMAVSYAVFCAFGFAIHKN